MKNHDALVVRRGQSFTIDLTLSRPYDPQYEDINVYFEFEKNIDKNSIPYNQWIIESKPNNDKSRLKINVSKITYF